MVVLLWNAGIKADFIKAKTLPVDKQKEYAFSQKSAYAIVIEDPFPYNSMLQVVNLASSQVMNL